MVTIEKVNKCVGWSNKHNAVKFLEQAVCLPHAAPDVRARAAELLARIKLEKEISHAWHSAKGNQKLAAIEAVLEAHRDNQSRKQLKNSCKQIGFNLKTGQVLGHALGRSVSNPKTRIDRDKVKAFKLVRFCLVTAH